MNIVVDVLELNGDETRGLGAREFMVLPRVGENITIWNASGGSDIYVVQHIEHAGRLAEDNSLIKRTLKIKIVVKRLGRAF